MQAPPADRGPSTRAGLVAQLSALGLAAGDAVLAHAALRGVGPILGGPDALIAALGDVIGPQGTLLGYTDWQSPPDELIADPAFRDAIPPFDPATSRAARENGSFPELVRTTPGARRSASPGASCVALGGDADWFIADHDFDYGYGPRSPFGKLVARQGRVLMLGAPLDTMTLLHHVEHLAKIDGKRVIRYEAPIRVNGKTIWRAFEEFDTSIPVAPGLADDYFVTIVEAFLATGRGRRGVVGRADCVLVPAAEIVPFAVSWLEQRFRIDP